MEATEKRRHYPKGYKKEAVLLVRSTATAQRKQRRVGTSAKNLQRGVKQQLQEKSGERLDADEHAELQCLRREVKTLRMGKKF